MKHKILKTALYIVLALLGVITVFPFVWMVLSSFKTNGEIQSIVQTLPQEATIDNYMNLQQTFDFLRYFMNSIFIAVAVTAIVIYTSCLCGYVLGKYQFKGKNVIFGFVMMTMMVPWSVTIIPRYTMFMEAGLQDTYISLILPVMVSGFGIFMMKQNMESIPDELIEVSLHGRFQRVPDIPQTGASTVQERNIRYRHLPVPLGMGRLPLAIPDD